jgi:two-component system chemotaxis sensor kinase CheA
MTDEEFNFSTGLPSEEMAAYLQMYLDETSEQLDALVEVLLSLEENPQHAGQLNEAFRLIHSIKGSSAMMGLDSITVLTHHLENHFERLRSGLQILDRPMMDLVLRCIDFLRECNQRLRSGQALASAPELLEELGTHVGTASSTAAQSPASFGQPAHAAGEGAPGTEATESADVEHSGDRELPVGHHLPDLPPFEPAVPEKYHWRVTVTFEQGLALADVKADLILQRLNALGLLADSAPPPDQLHLVAQTRRLQVLLSSERPAAEIRAAADVGGVELVELDRDRSPLSLDDELPVSGAGQVAQVPTEAPARAAREETPARQVNLSPSARENSEPLEPFQSGASAPAAGGDELDVTASTTRSATQRDNPRAESASEGKSRVVETVRVDIDRLDDLLNLAGELVVTNARFVQISRQMGPAFKKSGRTRAVGEGLRRLLEEIKARVQDPQDPRGAEWSQQLLELESEIDALDVQSRLWEEGRRCFTQISDAVNHLTRVSDNLQRGVLDTRMVPVGPLFNRFKRVVRDISQELGKQVLLEIRGEKTELDKRMIDELGDPLVHLVRNAIDHGLESAEIRRQKGKPAAGTLTLEAVHRGNNVFIRVSDDGGGINAARIRKRIVEKGLSTPEQAAQLSDQEIIEFIWHPGFSTAEKISDISGRGVGMDIVKTRIAELNGIISVETQLGRGTTFSIRLPLTLAIIRCLLFRLRHGMFAVPIDSVREIVSVPVDDIITIHGRHTFEVRGEFVPLVDIDDVFDWPGSAAVEEGERGSRERRRVNVVILQATHETIGLRVDELQGGQDIVIKSLAENFVHIRGLSGASILGDGTVCLLLDISAVIDLVIRGRTSVAGRELLAASS